MMAIDFSGIALTQWIGQVSGLPTIICGTNGRAVPVDIDWTIYGAPVGGSIGLTLDLTGINVVNELNQCVSVYIDNIGNNTPIYVLFPDTLFVAPCAANSAVWMPVATNGRRVIIYSVGQSVKGYGQTKLQFTNVFVPYSAQSVGLSTVANAVYVGTSLSPLNYQTEGVMTFTFSNRNLGPIAFNRYIVAIPFCINDNGDQNASNYSNVTALTYNIGGGPVAIPAIGVTTAAGQRIAANRFFAFRNDLNTTATFVMTTNSFSPNVIGQAGFGISIYQCTNLASAVPSDFADSITYQTNPTITLDTPDNGCLITHVVATINSITTLTIPQFTGSVLQTVTIDDDISAVFNLQPQPVFHRTLRMLCGHNNFGETGTVIPANLNPTTLRAASLRGVTFAAG